MIANENNILPDELRKELIRRTSYISEADRDTRAAFVDELARAAIEADRKQRGEPVAWKEIALDAIRRMRAGHVGCTDIMDRAEALLGAERKAPHPAEVPFCEECGDGIMAHDPGICGTCYQTKYVAPQHADPVKDDSDALTVAYMSGYHDGKRSTTPEGWRLVPKELIDFLDAKEHHLPVEDRHVLSIMLAAAPKFGEEE